MQAAASRSGEPVLYEHRLVEMALAKLVRATRILPRITARNAAAERVRLQQVLAAGEVPVPSFDYSAAHAALPSVRVIDRLRARVAGLAGASLYLAKLDELELDLALYCAVGDTRTLRPLAARRFGDGREPVPVHGELVSLYEHALLLVGADGAPEPARTLPAQGGDDQEPSLSALITRLAAHVGIEARVQVEPNLTAGAATGDRTVYVAARSFGVREALRLAVHEVLGHVVSAENGRAQPLRLVEWGTAGSFADQEGVALCIEEHFGLLDATRLRSLGGRVLATAALHDGASFGQTARMLHREHGFSAQESIVLCERAYRGGGVARDASYLSGYLRVRAAIGAGHVTLDELRMGRVSVSALPALRELIDAGYARTAVYRPNLPRNFFSTSSGTIPWRSPPSAAASLMSVELT